MKRTGSKYDGGGSLQSLTTKKSSNALVSRGEYDGGGQLDYESRVHTQIHNKPRPQESNHNRVLPLNDNELDGVDYVSDDEDQEQSGMLPAQSGNVLVDGSLPMAVVTATPVYQTDHNMTKKPSNRGMKTKGSAKRPSFNAGASHPVRKKSAGAEMLLHQV